MAILSFSNTAHQHMMHALHIDCCSANLQRHSPMSYGPQQRRAELN